MKRFLTVMAFCIGLAVCGLPQFDAHPMVAIQQAHAADIAPALKNTFGHEGGFQRDPDDSGNWYNGVNVGTKFGLAGKEHAAYFAKRGKQMTDITLADTVPVYRWYWDAGRCDEWSNQLAANLFFDLAVNAGPSAAVKVAQEAANRAAWPKPSIAVDGKAGAATIKRINEVNQKRFVTHFFGVGYGLYEKVVRANPVKAKYMRTWADRWAENGIMTVRGYDAKRTGK